MRDRARAPVASKSRAIGTPVESPTRGRRSSGAAARKSSGTGGPSRRGADRERAPRRDRGRAPRRDRERGRGRPDPGVRARVESAANTALILGIISIAVIALAGPFAIMKANEATSLARRARISVPGGATAGLVLGWIATILMIVGFALFALLFVGAAAAAGVG